MKRVSERAREREVLSRPAGYSHRFGLLCICCGNDFLPGLVSISVYDGDIALLISTYLQFQVTQTTMVCLPTATTLLPTTGASGFMFHIRDVLVVAVSVSQYLKMQPQHIHAHNM